MSAEFWWRMLLLSFSGFLSGATISVSLMYYRAWRTHDRHDWRGLLPAHVATVAMSYNLLIVYSTIETMIRISDNGDVPWWRAALLGPAYLLGFIAMAAIWQLRKKKSLVEEDRL